MKALSTKEKMSINRAATWADQKAKPVTIKPAPWEKKDTPEPKKETK